MEKRLTACIYFHFDGCCTEQKRVQKKTAATRTPKNNKNQSTQRQQDAFENKTKSFSPLHDREGEEQKENWQQHSIANIQNSRKKHRVSLYCILTSSMPTTPCWYNVFFQLLFFLLISILPWKMQRRSLYVCYFFTSHFMDAMLALRLQIPMYSHFHSHLVASLPRCIHISLFHQHVSASFFSLFFHSAWCCLKQTPSAFLYYLQHIFFYSRILDFEAWHKKKRRACSHVHLFATCSVGFSLLSCVASTYSFNGYFFATFCLYTLCPLRS